MPATVLSVATRAVAAACARLGLDASAIASAAGLSPEALGDADARIAAAHADAFWQEAYRRAGDPHLALHAAAALPLGAYQVIDYLGSTSATVGEAVARIARYFAIVDTRARLVVAPAGVETELALVTEAGGPVPRPAQEYTLAALVTRLRAMAEPFAVAEVAFAFPAPADVSEHARVLGVVPRFAAARPAIRFDASAWQTPIRTADPALRAILEQHAERVLAELPPPGGDVSSRVRDAVLETIRAGRPVQAASLARGLAMSTRTLQRRMADEGTELGRVIDEARAAAARAHLDDRRVSIAEVGWLLGFADQSTFGRAFKRWTGMSPAAWRRGAAAAR